MKVYWCVILLFLVGCLAGAAPVWANTQATQIPAATTPPAPPTPTREQVKEAMTRSINPNQQREIAVNSLKPDETVSQLQAKFSSVCFFCPIVGRLLASAMLFGEKIFTAFGPDTARFLGVTLGLWILWQAGKLLFPFGPVDRAGMIGNRVLTRILLGVAASAVLLIPGGYKLYWDNIYMPVVDGAVNLSSALLDVGMKDGTLLFELQKEQRDKYQPTQVAGLTEKQKAIKDKLELQVYSLQNAFTYGLAVGVYLFNSGAILTGSILTLAYVAAPIMFVVNILSSLLQWTFLSVLSPALIAAAVFPKTRNYTISAIKQMIGSGLSLVIASIVAVLSAAMVLFSLQTAYKALDNDNAWGTTPDWLRKMIVEDDLSRSNAIPVDGRAATPEGKEKATTDPKFKDALKSGLLPLPYRDTALQADITKTTKAGLQSGGYMQPTTGTFTSPFGPRTNPYTGEYKNHNGIDIANDIGTPIVASQSGEVIYAQWNDGGFGNLIEIRHPDGFYTRYAHLDKIYVQRGSRVMKGQAIGAMGSTGFSTGPHLHFEIRSSATNEPFDPQSILNGEMPNITAAGLSAMAGGFNAYADFLTPLDFSHKATWQILLAAVIPWMLIRSAPQAFNAALALPASPTAATLGQVAGGFFKAGAGVALTALASAGGLLQQLRLPSSNAPPDRSGEGSTDIVYAGNTGGGGGVNRDPQLAASYSDSLGRDENANSQLALPSAGMRDVDIDPRTATIDVEAVAMPDDDSMSVTPTQRMTDRAATSAAGDAREEEAATFTPDAESRRQTDGAPMDENQDAADAPAQEKSRLARLLEGTAFLTGSAMVGLAGGVAALGRAAGVNVTYERPSSSWEEDRGTSRGRAREESEGADEDDADSGDADSNSRTDALDAASDERRSRNQNRIAETGARLRLGSGSAPRVEAPDAQDKKSQNVMQMQAMVRNEQQKALQMVNTLAKNDLQGLYSGDLARVTGLAGSDLGSLDSYQLLSLLASLRSAAQSYESKINGLKKPTGGGARR